MKELLQALNQRPIAYFPVYVDICGDHATACVLSQLLYWWGVAGGKFYKSGIELQRECRLTPKQLKRIMQRLKVLDFVIVRREGIPARNHWDFDPEKLSAAIVEAAKNEDGRWGPTSFGEKGETEENNDLDGAYGQSSFVPNDHHSLAEKDNTRLSQKGQTIYRTETTTETTSEIKRKGRFAAQKKNEIEKPDEVEDQVWKDFLKVRKAKRAPLTTTAMRGIIREAGKASLTLNEALRKCVDRNWQGFEASWVKSNGRQQSTVYQYDDAPDPDFPF